MTTISYHDGVTTVKTLCSHAFSFKMWNVEPTYQKMPYKFILEHMFLYHQTHIPTHIQRLPQSHAYHRMKKDSFQKRILYKLVNVVIIITGKFLR